MFKVKKKGTDEISTVYAVSGTRFLLYIDGEDPRWEWHDMSCYEPTPMGKLLIVGSGSGKTLAMAERISSEALFNQAHYITIDYHQQGGITNEQYGQSPAAEPSGQQNETGGLQQHGPEALHPDLAF